LIPPNSGLYSRQHQRHHWVTKQASGLDLGAAAQVLQTHPSRFGENFGGTKHGRVSHVKTSLSFPTRKKKVDPLWSMTPIFWTNSDANHEQSHGRTPVRPWII